MQLRAQFCSLRRTWRTSWPATIDVCLRRDVIHADAGRLTALAIRVARGDRANKGAYYVQIRTY